MIPSSYFIFQTLSQTAGMKTSQEIRLANLRLLVEQAGSKAKLSQQTGVPAPFITQLVNGIPQPSGNPRKLGDDTARRLEIGMLKGEGWMDADHDAAAKGAWPFVLLSQKQAAALNSANRETVERLALHLLNSQPVTGLSDSTYIQNESSRVEVKPRPRGPIPVKRVAFDTPGVEEDRAKRSKPESIRAGKGRGH
jgi:hypothetical protein